jgi:hypothetical protein
VWRRSDELGREVRFDLRRGSGERRLGPVDIQRRVDEREPVVAVLELAHPPVELRARVAWKTVEVLPCEHRSVTEVVASTIVGRFNGTLLSSTPVCRSVSPVISGRDEQQSDELT